MSHADFRTVSVVDTDASAITPWDISGAAWISIGATCSQALAEVSFRVVYLDEFGSMTGCSPEIVCTAGSGKPDFAGQWIGTPSQDLPNNTCNLIHASSWWGFTNVAGCHDSRYMDVSHAVIRSAGAWLRSSLRCAWIFIRRIRAGMRVNQTQVSASLAIGLQP